MVAYNFKKRFIAPIRAGTKRHTIRAERAGKSRHAQPGEALQLYCGMRSKHVRLIAAPLCESVWPIQMDLIRSRVEYDGPAHWGGNDLDAFAMSDGFAGWEDLVDFWGREHPGVRVFSGVMIRWAPIETFPEAVARAGGAADGPLP